MTNFLPQDYKMPTGNYMKLQEGENTFRVLSSAVTGFEYWNTDNKPIRSKTGWKFLPEDIKIEDDGNTKINHFWAFVVWNYTDNKVQILQLTQKTIMSVIKSYVNNPKWGDPKGYDLVITKEKVGGKTSYTTMADPHSVVDPKISENYAQQNINLEALFVGGDPFMSKADSTPAGVVSQAEAAVQMENEVDPIAEGLNF